MGRPKTQSIDLPPRMMRRTRTLKSGAVWVGYYYNARNESGGIKEIPLGSDIREAKRKWAELECTDVPRDSSTMGFVFDRYEKEIIPQKSPRTQIDNIGELKFLRKVFDDAPINSITTAHLASYRDARTAKTRGNRELALFSHIFNMAREWGYTNKENPCRGLRKNKESPRDVYLDDETYQAIRECASQELRDAMDLAFLIGQRPEDVMKLKWSDIRDGELWITQNKTRKKLRFVLEGELGELIQQLRSRPCVGMYVITTVTKLKMSQSTRRELVNKARLEAARKYPHLVDSIRQFQFRDIRPKAASETDLSHAAELLGHADPKITERVYRRAGTIVKLRR